MDVASELRALEELEALLNELIPEFRFSAESNLKLERISALVEKLNHPERTYRTLHVGGTSGKGSVAAFAASILTHHGLKTGLHLSPYVQTLTETWQIDGRYVLPSRILSSVRRVIEISRRLPITSEFGPVSYFETKVAAALSLFGEERVDAAVIEVGLGGERDATNVLGPGIQVLTNVSLDHTDILGHTVEAIARDKVEIFKPDSLIISGVEQPTVKEIARHKAMTVGSPLLLLDEDLRLEVGDGALRIDMPDRPIEVDVPTTWPTYQYRNAALAVAATALFAPAVPRATIEQALRSVHLPARLEQISDNGRSVLLDGAHNPEKLRATVDHVNECYPGRKRIAVVALKQGKDVDASLAELKRGLDAVIFTGFSAGLWKPVPPKDLADSFRIAGFQGTVEVEEDPTRAVSRALELAPPGDVVVVTGSLYLAGNVRARWKSADVDLIEGRSYAVDSK